MGDFIPELLTLEEIILEHKSFKDAYFRAKVNEKLSNVGSKILKERISGVLRHYQTLSFECLDLLKDYQRGSEEFLLSLICLHVLRHEPELATSEVEHAYISTFNRMRLTGNVKDNFEILFQATRTSFRVPEQIKSNPFVYNSLRLEVPEFFLKKLAKDFKGELALKIAISLHGKNTPVFRMKNFTDISSFDPDYFDQFFLSKKTVIYKGKKQVSSAYLESNGFYPSSYLEALAYDKVTLPRVSPNILINGCKKPVSYLSLSYLTNEYFQSRVIPVFQDAIQYRYAMDVKNKYKLFNVYPLLSESHLMKTYLSYDEFDLVVCFGQDTKTGLCRQRIEILPALSEKMITVAAKREYTELVDSAQFVKKGGTLLFICNALDKEESVHVVEKFLKNNLSFRLQEQSFLFPFDSESEGGYYAILRRDA